MKTKIYLLIGIFTLILFSSCGKQISSSPATAGEWDHTLRPLRYYPDSSDFKIENGDLKFNRALYGTNTAFRIEAGDLPEFAFYMPGMGGNCQLALCNGEKTVWLTDCRHRITRYRPGAMIYEITDPVLGEGRLLLTAIAMADEEGLLLKAEFQNTPSTLQLLTLYGGASDKKFSRAGDLNADPADCFFLKPENCRNNHYVLYPNGFTLLYDNKLSLSRESLDSLQQLLQKGQWPITSQDKNLKIFTGSFPPSTTLTLATASDTKEKKILPAGDTLPVHPVVVAQTPVSTSEPLYICLHNPQKRMLIPAGELPGLYAQAEAKRQELTGRLVIHTPDSFLNTLGGVVSTVGDAIYEYPSYLHGAISWRMRLNGWRGAYVADVLGWHDRARNHFSAYAQSQLTHPLTAAVEMDTLLNLTRSRERLGNAMFSSGYICRNPGGDFRPHHYDMNLVFTDQLLNHFLWTGDQHYLREMWPVIERHLAWEKRVFDPDNDGLYDAYACIWASDGLMYNGGGVTHSSAYNYRANRLAAELARKIGKNPLPYQQEAEKILSAINRKLWLPHEGQWAEFADALGHRQVHPAAGIWTVYHAIDSEVPDAFQAYQALRYIDNQIPHIPLRIPELETEKLELISTTNWLPYSWSVNNVAFAELMHTALAYWQGGRPDQGFQLWKSAILDAMYCGISPGNIGQISFYDAARGETYRDFADPTGMAARSIVEGLFGIRPDLMNGRLHLRPGFPDSWPYASIHLPYIDFSYQASGDSCSYEIQSRLNQPVKINLEIPAVKEKIHSLTVNGQTARWQIHPDAIGKPVLTVELPAAPAHHISICWAGDSIRNNTPAITAAINELNVIEFQTDVLELKDPQQLISDQEISDSHVQVRLQGEPGEHTFFARLQQGEMKWWQPVHVHLGKAVEILPGNNENPGFLSFYIRNNSERELKGKMRLNPHLQNWEKELQIAPKSSSELIRIPAQYALKGTNTVQVEFSGKRYESPIVNWEIPLSKNHSFTLCEIDTFFNDRVTNIFKNRYLSPRSPYTTLQVPAQGIGEWCHPKLTAEIDDSGLRNKAPRNVFTTPFGLRFHFPSDSAASNIAFVSLWDNYPSRLSLPLAGKASHAYFLMAGTTNHMQSQFDNGQLKIYYKDNTCEILKLRNPETWAPIERDYYTDGYAFALKQSRPYRVVLKTGTVARDLEKILQGKKLDERYIPGGGALILDLPLDPHKELDHLELEALSNEVVIGLMGVTLQKASEAKTL